MYLVLLRFCLSEKGHPFYTVASLKASVMPVIATEYVACSVCLSVCRVGLLKPLNN